MATREDIKQTLVEWVNQQCEKNAKADIKETKSGYVVTIEPRNPKSARMVFHIGPTEVFDLTVGRSLGFEDITYSSSLLLDICESVRLGRVSERLWLTRGGTVSKSEGVLTLSQTEWHERRSHILSFLRRTEVCTVEYEPYDQPKSKYPY